MSTEGIVTGVVVGVVASCITAVVATKAARAVEQVQIESDLGEARHAAFNEGWNAASNHPTNIRQQYTRLFETENQEEETGTTFKTRQRKS